MINKNGDLYVIPTPLNEDLDDFYTLKQKERVNHIQHFVVENKKPARNSLKKLELNTPLQELKLHENNKNVQLNYEEVLDILKSGSDIGLISDCGLPGVADPGSELVLKCHYNNIKVKTIAQESSILSSLTCSGFNGQNFEFVGYLPIDKNKRKKYLSNLAVEIKKSKKTFIFIETPHRNLETFQFLLESLNAENLVCIAYDINGDSESILTNSIKGWEKINIEFEKKPCIFLVN
jgi:16S rRNA (cytidine1402-2'-O)-methyltransferase